MRRLLLWTFVPAVAAGLLLLVPADVLDIRQSSRVVTISASDAVQTFTAPVDQLSSVGLLLDESISGRATVTMVLFEEEQPEKPVRSVSLEIERRLQIPSDIPRPFLFSFDPIEDSKGRKFVASFKSDRVLPFLASMSDTYPQGSAIVDGSSRMSDLAFTVTHRANLASRIARLSGPAGPGLVTGILIITVAVWTAMTYAGTVVLRSFRYTVLRPSSR